jgi:hypothetical protein
MVIDFGLIQITEVNLKANAIWAWINKTGFGQVSKVLNVSV